MASFGFLGAIGGLGQGLSAVGEDIRKNENADANLGREQALAAWRQQTAQAYKIADEQRAQAPLNRLSAAAQAKAAEDVPLESAPVKTLAPDATLKTGGLSGNYDALVAQARSLPEADRAPYLAQLQQQRDRSQADADAAVVGKTRKRTSDESFGAAMDEAKLKDPQAYIAGKALITSKNQVVPAGSTVIRPDGTVLFDGSAAVDAKEDRRDARQREADLARDARQQVFIEAQEKRAAIINGVRGGISPQERIGYMGLFNAADRQVTGLRKDINELKAKPLYQIAKPGSKEQNELDALDAQLQAAQQERDVFKDLTLKTLGGDVTLRPASADSKPAPASPPASDNRAPKAPRPPLSSFMR